MKYQWELVYQWHRSVLGDVIFVITGNSNVPRDGRTHYRVLVFTMLGFPFEINFVAKATLRVIVHFFVTQPPSANYVITLNKWGDITDFVYEIGKFKIWLHDSSNLMNTTSSSQCMHLFIHVDLSFLRKIYV